MLRNKWFFSALLVAAVSCSNDNELKMETFDFYRNPVMQKNLPDPSVIKVDSLWYAFASENGENVIPALMSKNLVDWTEIDPVFTEETRPSFISGATVESPDVAYVGGQYVLYYSLVSAKATGIGAATSSVPFGPWTDQGELATSTSLGLGGVSNPSFISDGGENYLVFGSFGGLFLAKLSSDGLSLDNGSAPVKLADETFDAPTIIKQDGFYYLIASSGSETGEAASTSHLVMGRSQSISGPYVNKAGDDMMGGAYEEFVVKSVKFAGPGQGSSFVTDAEGESWMLYNSYDLSDVSLGRTLMLDKVKWTGGWPVVRGSIPSFCTDVPVVD